MKLNIMSQLIALFIGIGIIVLFIYSAKPDLIPEDKPINNYDKLLHRNEKANDLKRSIVSTLENIAYMQWSIDSLDLIEKKYDNMDSTLIERLEDIKFEFGFSNMLEKIKLERNKHVGNFINQYGEQLSIADKKSIIFSKIDSLRYELAYHQRSLDTVRSLSRHKFYLNQPRFNN